RGERPRAQAALARAPLPASTRRRGCHRPATAPNRERVALTTIAVANPALNAWGEATLPVAENTATAIAIPNTPPRKRNMLKMPDALPISVGATALRTAFWAPGTAIDTPAPARISGATRRT